MRGKDSEPIEPTPETDPFKYLCNLLGRKRARIIENADFNVWLVREGTRRNPIVITIHVITDPKEFFAITRSSELMVAMPNTPSVTGITEEELVGLENHTIETDFDPHNERQLDALAERAEKISEIASEEEMRKTRQEERAISVKLAKFVERRLKSSA